VLKHLRWCFQLSESFGTSFRAILKKFLFCHSEPSIKPLPFWVMKKLLLLLIIVALGAIAAKKIKATV